MKVRVKFAKSGAMKFIGHLDMMRYFQKAIRRAGIDIAYSGGFSPHQIMSFAAPLGVGLTSTGEYFDIELQSVTPAAEIKTKLAHTMVEGLEILAVTALSDQAGNAMASVAAAAYEITFTPETKLPTDWDSQLMTFYHRPAIPYTKVTPKVTREMDLKPLIYDLKVTPERLYLLVNASSSGNMKPAYLLEAFFAERGYRLPAFSLCICRRETYGNIGTAEAPQFVPLAELGI